MSDDHGVEPWAEIIRLHPERDLTDEDAPVATQPKKPWCQHVTVSLDMDARRVYCRKCDVEVPAFDYLKMLAQDWERWATHRKEAERRGRAASKRLEEILRLEKNARARLKKLDPTARPPRRPWGEGSVLF